jgi:acylphosphatase
MTDHVRLDAVVRGRVQGVGYRYFAQDAARRGGLSGWVLNDVDGSVRCRVEGSRSDLEAFLATLERGPAGAWVDRVEATWGAANGDLGPFIVRSRAHPGD